MIASLHHQDLEQALCDARALLRPGGHLLVVALVRPSNAVDHLWDAADALSNPLIGLVKHPRPARGAAETTEAVAMPVRQACTSPAELRARTRSVLRGAVLRRREGFRVTLRWQRPAAAGD